MFARLPDFLAALGVESRGTKRKSITEILVLSGEKVN